MSDITLLTGYEQQTESEQQDFVSVDRFTPSQKGYNFEHCELICLMNRLINFETVMFTDAYGVKLTPQIVRKRYGRDGGIDFVIHIVAPTERGARSIATRVRNIIINEDY